MAKFKRLKNFLAKLKAFFQKVDEKILHNIDLAIKITTKLKEALGSPVAVLITDLIPGEWDNEIRKKGEIALEYAIDALNIVKDCQDKPTVEEKIQCYLEHVRTFPPLLQHAVLAKLASTVAGQLDGNKHSEHLYDLWTQESYSVSK